ncbi:hypothetical protein [uncultured Gilvimarinus sp.]|uniref:hypothetical protein n=1 Tax=uncultured Gilvimarinus sp. TaxID=1689143 RepID=UPI0030D9965A
MGMFDCVIAAAFAVGSVAVVNDAGWPWEKVGGFVVGAAQVIIAVTALVAIIHSRAQNQSIERQDRQLEDQVAWNKKHQMATVRPVLSFDTATKVTVDGEVAYIDVTNEGLGPLRILSQNARVRGCPATEHGVINLSKIEKLLQEKFPSVSFSSKCLVFSDGEWLGVGRTIRLLRLEYRGGGDHAALSRFSDALLDNMRETYIRFEYSCVHGNRFYSQLNVIREGGPPRTEYGEMGPL